MAEAELLDRRALVTGGGRGIGKAIALELARAGARLALLARTRSELDEVAAEIDALGREECRVVVADLGETDQVREGLAELLDAWGGVDVLVNNAAILGPIGRTDRVSPVAWTQTLQVNLFACFLCTHLVLPGMIQRNSGKIINLSGGGAVSPRPYFAAYSAAKAGVVRFTETLSEEVAEFRIDVNAMAPGAVHTRMFDQVVAAGDTIGSGEVASARQQAEDGGGEATHAAALALFLASPRSDGLSGRLLSAVWDAWEEIDVEAVMSSDEFTVRRIKPIDPSS